MNNTCTYLLALTLSLTGLSLSAQNKKKIEADKQDGPVTELVVKTVYNPRPLMDALIKKTHNGAIT